MKVLFSYKRSKLLLVLGGLFDMGISWILSWIQRNRMEEIKKNSNYV